MGLKYYWANYDVLLSSDLLLLIEILTFIITATAIVTITHIFLTEIEKHNQTNKELLRTLEDNNNRLQAANEELERFAYIASHDLKTPITRLRLRAEMLDDDDAREAMIRDLEDLDMLVKGAIQSVKETDIHDIQKSTQHTPQTLVIQGTLKAPYTGKPLAIRRCLGNLIDNALYYGHKADVILEDSDSELCIRICDNGPGIPDAKIDRVFEPYTQLATARGSRPGSVGLGLSIARNIARAHGGEVTLRNREQVGLEVRLRLPRH